MACSMGNDIDRRAFLFGMGLFLLPEAKPALAVEPSVPGGFAGMVDATHHGIDANSRKDQSRVLNGLIAATARNNMILLLPPGKLLVSNIDLPDRTRIQGVAGATRLVYSGGGRFLTANGANSIDLTGLDLDGAGEPMATETMALLQVTGSANIHASRCSFSRSSRYGLWLQNSGGTVRDSTMSDCAMSAIYAVESQNLSISGNTVERCGNGGILVHRWTKADDGTILSLNRISGIAANAGGTGENGNGINVFRADNVMIINNIISGCAFSAIRSNAGSNVQILGNQCRASGETAIYSEFGFEGAIVAGNLVDGAANGISIVNFNEGGRLATVSGNIVRNLSKTGPYPAEGMGFGIGIAAEADTAITGNVIENAPKCGLLLGWGTFLRDVTATANVVRNSPVGCAVTVVEGAGAALLSGNLFDNTPLGAILGYRWTEPATAELASASATSFANVTLASNLATPP